ncbi:MAG: hypothetical protein GY719_28710 [bacterium]|nr:hypothetical protein [bacterium]
MFRTAGLVLLAITCLAAGAAAQPVAHGAEFQVNTYTTSGQAYPEVSAHSDGSFVVIWQSAGSFGTDTAGLSIQGQRYASDGSPLAGEFQVNTYTSSNQFLPVVDQGPDGGFVAAWSSFGSPGNDFNLASVQARRYAADGTALGAQFQVNSVVAGQQRIPEVSVARDGGFVVLWLNQAVDAGDVAGQRYASDGSPLGAELQVNTYTTSFQGSASAAHWDNGDFVVVWESVGSSNGDTSGFSIQGQRFASDGTTLGTQFLVNSSVSNDQRRPAVDTLASGEFVVAWESDPTAPDLIFYGVRARRFAPDGTGIGNDFQVNSYTFGNQDRVSVTRGGASEFIVSWESDGLQGSSPSPNCIQVRRFDSSGTALADDLLVNTYTTDDQAVPDIAAAGDNFVVTWSSEGSFGTDTDPFLTSAQGQRFRSTCSQSLDLVADLWTLVSLPCDVGAADTVADVIGDDLVPGDLGTRWAMFSRDEASQTYVALALTDTLSEGEGYWLKTLDSGQSVDFEGLSNLVLEVPLVADASSGRLNMVGHPVPWNVCWADVRVIDGSSVLSLAQADPVVGSERACAMTPPHASCVMSRQAYKWTGSAYASFDGETLGAEGTLGAFEGLWVKAFKSGIELRVPALESSSCAAGTRSASAERQSLRGGWFVRLAAEVGDLSDDSAVFGQLASSAFGYDTHDLPKLAPFGNRYLTVVFPHPDWGDRAGDYATDFHGGADILGQADAWTFEIQASSPGQKVTLSWEGPRWMRKRARLIDVETGQQVEPDGNSYTFLMPGTRHSFTWRLVETP